YWIISGVGPILTPRFERSRDCRTRSSCAPGVNRWTADTEGSGLDTDGAAKMVAVLGEIAKLGRTGRLLLDSGRGETGGALQFARGSLRAYRAPGAAAYTHGIQPALRQQIVAAAGGREGPAREARFEPLDDVGPSAAGAFTAADLAIEFARSIEDEGWLKGR